MKNLFQILSLFILLNTQYSFVIAQNLVPNPSFEDTVYCPLGPSSIDASQNWFACGNSPDYFNICSSGNAGVPSNFFGYQQPLDGNSYAGIYCYDPTSNYREYIGAQLTQQLIIGIKYFVSAYISRSDIHFIASDKFGFRFTNSLYSVSNPAPTDNFANVFSTIIVNDSINWVKIEGSFIADSTYMYLVLGNFFDSLNTNTSNFSSSDASYYYIDAVCVSTDSLVCTNLNNVENNIQTRISIFPNPVNSVLTIDNLPSHSLFFIYDNIGHIIFKGDTNDESINIDVSAYSKGLYIIRINEKYYYKFLVN